MRRRQALVALAGASGWPVLARAASAPPRLPDARLLDQSGAEHRLRALCEVPVVIGFFYTGCSTVCPPLTAALRDLRAQLDAGAARAGLGGARLLSISVDPLSDTPPALRSYAERFGLRLGLEAGWLMLTGQPGELARVWSTFGVPVGDPEAHSALLWLGSAARGRWTRAAALTPTARLIQLLESVAV